MNKAEYLFKTLSRTKRKDKENYVINRIYHLLNDLDIQPVTQQYAQRSDRKYALLDLYFPQLNIAIECDEEHHEQNQTDDTIRTFDIKQMQMEDILGSVTEEFELFRVKMYNTDIETINKEIDDIVSKIKQKKAALGEGFFPWNIVKNDVSKALEQGSISVDDNYFFRVNEEYRTLFGKNGKSQKSYYSINSNYHLWGPNLYKDTDTISEINAKWVNLLSKDWNELYELCKTDVPNLKLEDTKRITFGKTKNTLGIKGYRFIGVYNKTNRVKEIQGYQFAVYERVSRTLDLKQFR